MLATDFPAGSDPLADVFRFLRLSGSFYSRCEFAAPWGVALPPLPGTMMFHVVTTGRSRLEVPGAAPRRLQTGDLALVPHGDGHLLASEAGAPVVPLAGLQRDPVSDRYEVLRLAGNGETTGLLCGTVRFDDPAGRHLLANLPRLIVLEAARSPYTEWIHGTVRLLAAEAAALRPGGETVITRLGDVLVIQAIQTWMEQDPAARTGWLGALRDPRVGRAIACLHRDPARGWTLAALAREAAMSRSAFAARFAELVGLPPMQYLARWRMHVAHARLQEHDEGLAELAGRLGYQSEAAFKRAFKRIVGVAPGTLRRTARGPRSATPAGAAS